MKVNKYFPSHAVHWPRPGDQVGHPERPRRRISLGVIERAGGGAAELEILLPVGTYTASGPLALNGSWKFMQIFLIV